MHNCRTNALLEQSLDHLGWTPGIGLSNLLLGFTELESMELAFFKNPQLILMETND